MKNSNKLYPIIIIVLCLIINGIFNSSYAGDAVLTWTAPATNVDGTDLIDLAGYKVYYGTSAGTYNSSLDVGNITTTNVANLTENITYFFVVTAYDTSGNESSHSNEVKKTIDLTPPVGKVLINNGEPYTNISTVTLTLTCTDSISGCVQMQFSEDNINWGAWEAYSLNKTYIFSSGDGTKTIYVKFQDIAGNISIANSGTIIVDTTPASGSLTINNGAIFTTSSGVTLTPICNDSTSGCTWMQISNNNSTWSPWMSYSTNLNWQLSSSDGNHAVYIQFKDSAGNLSGTYIDTIILDTTSPIISGITSTNVSNYDATITWTTDESSTSQVEYGTSNLYGAFSNPDNNYITSHSVVLTGLIPNTPYYFRVLSTDQSGNQATSTESTFTTLKIMQPETPAPIADLRINPLQSTKNSIVLNWTATGANGTEGTATGYDLRMSSYRIIEDDINPKQGEINFSKAPQITGLNLPAAAGTAEAFQVNQLAPNSVYYFAIKAIDEKGNVSAISNIINGDNVPALPLTALRNGYTIISIPITPPTSDAQALLSGVVGYPVEVFSWASNGTPNGGGSSSFIAETNIVPGHGYLLRSYSDNAILNLTGTIITDPARAIPLQSGWNMIGNPYPEDVPLINTYIRNIGTGDLKNYEEAVIAGWVSNALYSYKGSTYSFVLYNSAVLKIWQGYWIALLVDGQYELVINKP